MSYSYYYYNIIYIIIYNNKNSNILYIGIIFSFLKLYMAYSVDVYSYRSRGASEALKGDYERVADVDAGRLLF